MVTKEIEKAKSVLLMIQNDLSNPEGELIEEIHINAIEVVLDYLDSIERQIT